ncbi:MAG: MBL fold metallo-hydrolase [Gammaproteobacteria bacterium]|nr:MBL fold metallo-hydrolase [Gammaproteobacteria bacterium]
MLIRKTFPVGPLQCNCSIIGDDVTKQALVVDPGGEAQMIYAELQTLGLKLKAIIHTHAHLDHILAAGELKRLTGAPIILHKDDKFLWDSLEMQCNMFGIPYVAQPDPDEWVHDDQDLKCCDGVAIHTPGHTPGSICFWFESHDLLIAGDTLFLGSIGRTDIWGGDFDAIQKSIRERLYTLTDDAVVVTGHGPDTTIGAEKTGNAFIRA